MKNACLPDKRGAIHSTGMAASQVHAQTGVSPVPRKKSAADIAKHGEASAVPLGFESMKKSPMRAVNQLPKLFLGKADASGAIQHDVAVHVGPKSEGYLPDIVLAEVTVLHSRCNRVSDGIESGRAASAEIFGKTAGARAGAGEDVIENAWPRESIVDVAFHHCDQPGFATSAQWMGLDVLEQLGELA